MHIYMCTHMYTYTNMNRFIHTHTHINLRIHEHACIHNHIRLRGRQYIHMQINMHRVIYICTYEYMHIHIYGYICTDIYIDIRIYIMQYARTYNFTHNPPLLIICIQHGDFGSNLGSKMDPKTSPNGVESLFKMWT